MLGYTQRPGVVTLLICVLDSDSEERQGSMACGLAWEALLYGAANAVLNGGAQSPGPGSIVEDRRAVVIRRLGRRARARQLGETTFEERQVENVRGVRKNPSAALSEPKGSTVATSLKQPSPYQVPFSPIEVPLGERISGFRVLRSSSTDP